MSITSTIQPHRTKNTRVVALVVTGMLVIMLLAQLYGYEKFASILTLVMPSHNEVQSVIFAAVVVILELLALPYLIEMRLSKLMRVLSALSGIAVGLFWLFTSLTSAHVQNSALFSDTVPLPGGVIAVVWSMLLAVLVIYVSYSNSRPASSS